MVEGKRKKKSGTARSVYLKPSVGEMIDERAAKAGTTFGPFVLESALRDFPIPKNLPESLQSEIAISIFTLEKILQIWIENSNSEWLQDSLQQSITETLAESEVFEAAMFDEEEPMPLDQQTEIAVAILTVDAAVKAYLKKAGLEEIYAKAHNESRIRVLNEMRLG